MSPSPLDFVGFLAYLVAMNGGVPSGDTISGLAAGINTLRDGYEVVEPTTTETPIAGEGWPVPAPPPELEVVPAPLFETPAFPYAAELAFTAR